MPKVDLRPISLQRLDQGLYTPIPEEKLEVWKNITIPQTNIRKETGGYKPFSITRQAHFHPARTKFVAGGVRGSKSVSTAMEILPWMLHSDLIWLGGEAYVDCRQEFEYIAEAALSLGWTNNRQISFPQNQYQPCVLETNWGCLLETKSTADESSLMSRAPDVIGLCEPGKMSLAAYRRAKERLSTRRGLLYMGGTFENTAAWLENFWHKWKRWPNQDNAKSWTSPTFINKVIFPYGVNDPEYIGLKNDILYAHDALTGDTPGWDEFLRRLVGVPAATPELIFSDTFKPRTHIANVPYVRWRGDELEPVYAAIDPGYSGNSRYIVLAIQVIGKEIRVLDEIVGKGLTHEQMKYESAKKEWWPAMHSGTIDPYAGESHVYGGTAPADVWRQDKAPGPVNVRAPQRLKNTDEEIRLMKTYLTGINGWQLRISDRCERLRWELGTWKRKKTNNVIGEPLKIGNDAIKALIYFLTHHSNGEIAVSSRQEVRILDYNLVGVGASIDPVYALQLEVQEEMEDQRIWGSKESGWI